MNKASKLGVSFLGLLTSAIVWGGCATTIIGGSGGSGGSGGTCPGTCLTCETPAGTGHECVTATTTSTAINATCPSGTTSLSSCPTAGALGTCTVTESAGGVSDTVATIYYTDSGITASDAQAACKSEGGTWSAG
jgi:hypothetical protein